MTLDQLRIFAAVAECEHVTRAAGKLHLTQSSVSAALATLEARYGTPLFHRVGRRIELTEIGRSFLPEARAVLARADAAARLLAEFSALERGTLSVAASQTIASYWLPQRLGGFHAHYPRIEIRVAIGNTAQTARAVLDGAADLGFIEGAIDEPALAVQTVGADRLVIFARPGHPILARSAIAPSDLMALDWVSREAGSGTRTEFEAGLEALGLDPAALRIALELPSNEAILGAIAVGVGVGAVSELAGAPRIDAGLLRRLDFELPARCFHAVRHKERYFSRIAQVFLGGFAQGR